MNLKTILDNHALWLKDSTQGKRADLRGAYLIGADLHGADLRGADLRQADLEGTDLRGADLEGADLRGADLLGANLLGANLRWANLLGANLRWANLRGADLEGAKLPDFQIPPDTELIVFKKLQCGVIATLRIPAEAKRTASLVGNKCRCEFAEVISLSSGEVGFSKHDRSFQYRVGSIVKPTNGYNDDIREECQPGIHFFMTRTEAEQY